MVSRFKQTGLLEPLTPLTLMLTQLSPTRSSQMRCELTSPPKPMQPYPYTQILDILRKYYVTFLTLKGGNITDRFYLCHIFCVPSVIMNLI